MRPNVLGIDPGLAGAVCLLTIDKPRNIVVLEDLPLNGNTIDGTAFSAFLDIHGSSLRFCVIEKVSAMVYTDATGAIRGQGAAASFNFGKGYGILLGCLASAQIPLVEVVPSVWKILLGLSSKKGDSIALAKKSYPASASKITLKKHDGRAEALLLAHFGAERFVSEGKK